MSDQKISAMPDSLALDGTELVPLVQDGANVKTTISAIRLFNFAYGGFSDSTDQSGSLESGTAVTFNTTDVADGVTLVDDTKITVPNTGIYNLQFSIQFKNIDNAQHEAVVWVKVNNQDLSNSSTQFTISARKNQSVFGYTVGTVTYMLDLDANDYVEIYWLPNSENVTIEALPASEDPAYPAIPSIIACVLQVA